MSKRDDVLAEAFAAHGKFAKGGWPTDRDTGLSRQEVNAFRHDMLVAARAALRIAKLTVGSEAAVCRANEALDDRNRLWDGVHRKRPADWREEYQVAVANLAAVALDAVMSIDDQRALEGRTFYEAEPAE